MKKLSIPVTAALVVGSLASGVTVAGARPSNLPADDDASSSRSARVTSGDDAGPHTLRDALLGGATHIVIDPSVATIEIETTLEYWSLTPLTIRGSGQTVDGSNISEGIDTDVTEL